MRWEGDHKLGVHTCPTCCPHPTSCWDNEDWLTGGGAGEAPMCQGPNDQGRSCQKSFISTQEWGEVNSKETDICNNSTVMCL